MELSELGQLDFSDRIQPGSSSNIDDKLHRDDDTIESGHLTQPPGTVRYPPKRNRP